MMATIEYASASPYGVIGLNKADTPQWDDDWNEPSNEIHTPKRTMYGFETSRKWWERLFYCVGKDILALVHRTNSIRRKINAQSPVLEHAVGDIDWLKKRVSKLLADNESLRSVALHRWRDAVRAELEKLGCRDMRAAMELPLSVWVVRSEGEVALPPANKACYDEVYDAVGQYRDNFQPGTWAARMSDRSPELFEHHWSHAITSPDHAADPSPSWTPPKAEPRRRKKGASR